MNGQTYDGGLESPVEVRKSDKFPIRYNPANPARNSAEPYGDWEKHYDWGLAVMLLAVVIFFYFKK